MSSCRLYSPGSMPLVPEPVHMRWAPFLYPCLSYEPRDMTAGKWCNWNIVIMPVTDNETNEEHSPDAKCGSHLVCEPPAADPSDLKPNKRPCQRPPELEEMEQYSIDLVKLKDDRRSSQYSPRPGRVLTLLVSFFYPQPPHELLDMAPVRQCIDRMSRPYSPESASCASEPAMILWAPLHYHCLQDEPWDMIADKWSSCDVVKITDDGAGEECSPDTTNGCYISPELARQQWGHLPPLLSQRCIQHVSLVHGMREIEPHACLDSLRPLCYAACACLMLLPLPFCSL